MSKSEMLRSHYACQLLCRRVWTDNNKYD